MGSTIVMLYMHGQWFQPVGILIQWLWFIAYAPWSFTFNFFDNQSGIFFASILNSALHTIVYKKIASMYRARVIP